MNCGITGKEAERGFVTMYFIYILKKLISKVCKPYVLKIHSVLQEVGVGERKLCVVINYIFVCTLLCLIGTEWNRRRGLMQLNSQCNFEVSRVQWDYIRHL